MEHDLNITLYVNIITVKFTGFVSTGLVQVIIISFICQMGVVNGNAIKSSRVTITAMEKTIGKLNKFTGKVYLFGKLNKFTGKVYLFGKLNKFTGKVYLLITGARYASKVETKVCLIHLSRIL